MLEGLVGPFQLFLLAGQLVEDAPHKGLPVLGLAGRAEVAAAEEHHVVSLPFALAVTADKDIGEPILDVAPNPAEQGIELRVARLAERARFAEQGIDAVFERAARVRRQRHEPLASGRIPDGKTFAEPLRARPLDADPPDHLAEPRVPFDAVDQRRYRAADQERSADGLQVALNTPPNLKGFPRVLDQVPWQQREDSVDRAVRLPQAPDQPAEILQPPLLLRPLVGGQDHRSPLVGQGGRLGAAGAHHHRAADSVLGRAETGFRRAFLRGLVRIDVSRLADDRSPQRAAMRRSGFRAGGGELARPFRAPRGRGKPAQGTRVAAHKVDTVGVGVPVERRRAVRHVLHRQFHARRAKQRFFLPFARRPRDKKKRNPRRAQPPLLQLRQSRPPRRVNVRIARLIPLQPEPQHVVDDDRNHHHEDRNHDHTDRIEPVFHRDAVLGEPERQQRRDHRDDKKHGNKDRRPSGQRKARQSLTGREQPCGRREQRPQGISHRVKKLAEEAHDVGRCQFLIFWYSVFSSTLVPKL